MCSDISVTHSVGPQPGGYPFTGKSNTGKPAWGTSQAGLMSKAGGQTWEGPPSPHTGLTMVKSSLWSGHNKTVGAYPPPALA